MTQPGFSNKVTEDDNLILNHYCIGGVHFYWVSYGKPQLFFTLGLIKLVDRESISGFGLCN